MSTPKKASRAKPKQASEPDPVSPRIARRERRRERSRDEIVDAARRVLVKNGIAGTTLEAVAVEVGLTKAALYYYYPSKEALFFDVMFGSISMQVDAVHAAVESAKNGGEAISALIRETLRTFSTRLDDFRLAYLQAQLVKPGSVRFTPEQFAKLRPLNERLLAGTTKRLTDERKASRGRAHVEPRLLTFLAYTAALGVLTMKGLVESVGDPLVYSDEQLIEGLASIFDAAASP